MSRQVDVPLAPLMTDRSARPWRTELTPVAFLERSANVFRERTAVIDGAQRITYAELGERVGRLAAALR